MNLSHNHSSCLVYTTVSHEWDSLDCCLKSEQIVRVWNWKPCQIPTVIVCLKRDFRGVWTLPCHHNVMSDSATSDKRLPSCEVTPVLTLIPQVWVKPLCRDFIFLTSWWGATDSEIKAPPLVGAMLSSSLTLNRSEYSFACFTCCHDFYPRRLL